MKFFLRNILFILAPLFLSNCKVSSKQKSDMIVIDSVKVYKEFKIRGHSHASAGAVFLQFDTLIKAATSFVFMADEEKEKLATILNRADKKKLKTSIFVGDLLFCEIKFSFKNSYSRVAISVSSERAIISDLTNMRNYIVINLSDLEWLRSFEERVRNS